MPGPAAPDRRAAATAAGRPVRIRIDADATVSGRWLRPARARALLVLAHGAGAGMDHPFLAALARALAGRAVATLRFQFPSMEQGRRRPDPPAVCHAVVRAAVARARELAPRLRLFAGGKSFGGRMTSQAQAEAPLAGVRGLVFVGFPLHPPQRPGVARAAHLDGVALPMLFLQGTRDALAERGRMRRVVERLGSRATVAWFEEADHAFHVPARRGSDDDVIAALAAAIAAFVGQSGR